MNNKKYLVWISSLGIGQKRLTELLKKYKSLKEIWNAKKEDLMEIYGIGETIAKKLTDNSYKEEINKTVEKMLEQKISIITIEDTEYPNNLKNIYDKPLVLYVKGNKEILKEFSIAVIGCRECSNYGKNVAKNIGYSLAKHNINVISGMAKGIDTYSHIGCMEAQGKTIAVLGNGLDYVYPKENIKIYNEIIETGGAIISEYINGTRPSKMNFPARNRIISGLSDGVIVVEAKEKSGTLITVDFALEQGKDVFIVPGNITSNNSRGTNNLIKQGAKLITCMEDVLEEYVN